MKHVLYFLAIDIVLLAVAAKLIFGRIRFFLKALYIYFYPDEISAPPFSKWEKKHDGNHKVNLMYFAALALLMLNCLYYYLFIDSTFFLFNSSLLCFKPNLLVIIPGTVVVDKEFLSCFDISYSNDADCTFVEIHAVFAIGLV
jgi:hypothetical protein